MFHHSHRYQTIRDSHRWCETMKNEKEKKQFCLQFFQIANYFHVIKSFLLHTNGVSGCVCVCGSSYANLFMYMYVPFCPVSFHSIINWRYVHTCTLLHVHEKSTWICTHTHTRIQMLSWGYNWHLMLSEDWFRQSFLTIYYTIIFAKIRHFPVNISSNGPLTQTRCAYDKLMCQTIYFQLLPHSFIWG